MGATKVILIHVRTAQSATLLLALSPFAFRVNELGAHRSQPI